MDIKYMWLADDIHVGLHAVNKVNNLVQGVVVGFCSTAAKRYGVCHVTTDGCFVGVGDELQDVADFLTKQNYAPVSKRMVQEAFSKDLPKHIPGKRPGQL